MTLCLPDYKILIREIKQMNQSLNRSASALAMLGLLSSTAFAADGFKLRYPFQGSLGGEIAAPLNQPGWFASLAVVGVDIKKNTGADGNERQLSLSDKLPMPELTQVISGAVAQATALATATATATATPLATTAGTALGLSGSALTDFVAWKVNGEVAKAVATATTQATAQARLIVNDANTAGYNAGKPIGSYDAKTSVKLSQQQTNAALSVGYAFDQMVAGGRVVANITFPYTAQLNRTAGTEPLVFNSTPAGALPGFLSSVYGKASAEARGRLDTALAGYARDNSGSVSGQGDAELTGAWTYVKDSVKVAAGLTLALPTGDYNAGVGQVGANSVAGVNIGFGNYYTLRPGLAVAYSPTPDWTIGAKASYGFNTKNKDNDIRSGDYVGIDLAAVYKTSIGVIGPHLMYVNQVKDDTYGDKSSDQSKAFGANRFNMQGAGVVFTTLIPSIDAGLTLSYMNTIDSKNALAGSFTMVRLTKKF